MDADAAWELVIHWAGEGFSNKLDSSVICSIHNHLMGDDPGDFYWSLAQTTCGVPG